MIHNDKYAEMLRRGQEDGLRYCIRQYSVALRYYAFKIIHNKEASEEIVSESFVKLWQKREKAVSIQSIKSFLYLITRNACFDYLGAQHQRCILLAEESALDGEDVGYDILSQITYNELILLLGKEADKLPTRQAEVFKMAYIQGMQTEEICEVLDISASNVYFTKSKALETIRKVLKYKGLFLCVSKFFVIFGI